MTTTSLSRALERLVEAHIFIDDTPGISLSEMRAKARRLRQTMGGLDLIVIDYLQLMSSACPGRGSGGTRTARRRSRRSRAG